MDIANQLFSLTLGVEPNKHTLQSLASTLNSAGKSSMSQFPASPASHSHVLSLADKQKALEQFADTAEAQKFVSQAPIPNQQQQLSQPQIQYVQAAPTPQAQKARRAKILRNPVVWQVTEQQLKELQWKRKQLLQAQKAEVERKKAARAKRPAPPKLGLSKNASRAGSVAGGNKAPQAKVLDPKAPRAKPASPKAPQAKNPQKAPAKAAAKAPQVPKGSARK